MPLICSRSRLKAAVPFLRARRTSPVPKVATTEYANQC